MSNTEIFELHYSFINPVTVYFNWNLSIYSPSDTIDTDTFYISYTNQTTSLTAVISTGNVMNHLLVFNPETTYSIFVYSINQYSAQSPNSNTVVIHPGNEYENPVRTNGYIRIYEPTNLFTGTIEDLTDVVTVSATSSGIASQEPTFVEIVTPTSPKPFYQLYKIDPKGQLFGNTPCTASAFKKRVIKI